MHEFPPDTVLLVSPYIYIDAGQPCGEAGMTHHSSTVRVQAILLEPYVPLRGMMIASQITVNELNGGSVLHVRFHQACGRELLGAEPLGSLLKPILSIIFKGVTGYESLEMFSLMICKGIL